MAHRSDTKNRPLHAFAIHGRARGELLDYQSFFLALSSVPAKRRQTSVGEYVVAITAMEEVADDRWAMRFVSGTEGLAPLYFDPESGQESTADLGTKVVADASWVFVDTRSRMVVVDRGRPGVAVRVIEKALSILGRELGLSPDLVVSLTPVTGPGFLKELDSYDRIREAAVVVSRPNYNWSDSADQLSGYAADSNAQRFDVVASAVRGESLSKDKGIVADIKSLASRRLSAIFDVRIRGRRSGQTQETTLSLSKHQEKRFVAVARNAPGSAVRSAIQEESTSFLDQLDTDEGDEA